jgi:hypothetical protein
MDVLAGRTRSPLNQNRVKEMGSLLDLVPGQSYSSLSELGLCRYPTDPSPTLRRLH